MDALKVAGGLTDSAYNEVVRISRCPPGKPPELTEHFVSPMLREQKTPTKLEDGDWICVAQPLRESAPVSTVSGTPGAGNGGGR